MARPETTTDIGIEQTEFATVDVDKIADRGDYLKAYATFMETVQKLGGEVEMSYRTTARFTRPPTGKEQATQLKTAQDLWDTHKKYYDTLAEVGELEYAHLRNYAQEWARDEGLPFPPPHEPISEFHRVIAGIDEAVNEGTSD
jgi:hypothetical protein